MWKLNSNLLILNISIDKKLNRKILNYYFLTIKPQRIKKSSGMWKRKKKFNESDWSLHFLLALENNLKISLDTTYFSTYIDYLNAFIKKIYRQIHRTLNSYDSRMKLWKTSIIFHLTSSCLLNHSQKLFS